MIVLLICIILGSVLNDRLTKDKPFQGRDRKTLQLLGIFYGFAVWFVVINPFIGRYAEYETNVKSVEIKTIKHESDQEDMDILVYGYNTLDGARVVPTENRINIKKLDSIVVVPDLELFQGDTIKNSARFVAVTEKSISQWYYIGTRDKTSYLRLSRSDYKKLPPVFRKYRKDRFVFRGDSIQLPVVQDTIK